MRIQEDIACSFSKEVKESNIASFKTLNLRKSARVLAHMDTLPGVPENGLIPRRLQGPLAST